VLPERLEARTQSVPIDLFFRGETDHTLQWIDDARRECHIRRWWPGASSASLNPPQTQRRALQRLCSHTVPRLE